MPDVLYTYSFDRSQNGPGITGSAVPVNPFNTNLPDMNQTAINVIYKNLDDMFLRFFCIRADKSELERFKESGISAIREIKKSLDTLGLKFREDR